MNKARQNLVTLAIYLNSRGFAFVLFEGMLLPYDWALFELRGQRRLARSRCKMAGLLDRYQPDVLVIQDTGPDGTRRRSRLVTMNAALESMARQHGIPVFRYSRAEVYDTFASTGFSNKQALAGVIAKHLPAFERFVPPPRKPWKSEAARMGLFDAAALALVFFRKTGLA